MKFYKVQEIELSIKLNQREKITLTIKREEAEVFNYTYELLGNI